MRGKFMYAGFPRNNSDAHLGQKPGSLHIFARV